MRAWLHAVVRRGWPAALAMLALTAYLAPGLRLNGDGAEYLLMATAIGWHGTPVILPDDVRYFLQQPADWLAQWGFPADFHQQLMDRLGSPAPISWGGYAWFDGSRLYAIHFWLYSLLAAPLALPLTALHGNPMLAFLAVNLGFLLLCWRALARVVPDWAGTGLLVLLLCGTQFYLAWSGPEVMTAACVLLAILAAVAGAPGWSMLAAGAGAAQSPSLLLLMPLALALHWLGRLWPQACLPQQGWRPLHWRDAVLGGAGLLLAGAPFAWFLRTLGVASIPGKYFTDPSWLSANRLHSLLFDLDQGMLAGVPGLMLAFALAPWLVARTARRGVWLFSALMLALVLAMAIPAATAINWNSGAVVMMRYAYWLAMPMLAAVLLALPLMAKGRAVALVGVLLLAQAAVMGANGTFGQRANYNEHSLLTKAVLDTHPAWYNPDPEIFFERSGNHDGPVPLDPAGVAVWRVRGQVVKLMHHRSQPVPKVCPPGSVLRGSQGVEVDRGWQYWHAPFHCEAQATTVLEPMWLFGRAHPEQRSALVSGWSVQEEAGTWTDGVRSVLRLTDLPSDAVALHVAGEYYGGQRDTEVWIGGRMVARLALDHGRLALPPATGASLEIELRHPQAVSPSARGLAKDGRLLGLFLRSVQLERRRPARASALPPQW